MGKRHPALDGFYRFIDQPLYVWTRPLLVVLLVPLVIGLFYPLWHMEMQAPQYPNGLSIDVYAHKIVGGHDGNDISEINILNHYIGMHKLERAAFTELDWLPFGFGVLALLQLRVAAIGNVRSLVDLAVLASYFAGFGIARFVFRLHSYGHDLSHDAPVKVQPFTPVVWGTKQIANFTTTASPQVGAYLIAACLFGLIALTAVHLVEGRRRAKRAGELDA